MIDINDSNYNNLVIEKENEYFIIFFTSKTCPHCETVKKYLNIIDNDINKPENLTIYKCQAEKSQKLLNLYNIRSFPTTFFFNKNKKIDSYIIGAEPIENFVKNIKKLNKKSIFEKIFKK